jgi:hypothetical protein
LLSAFHTGRDDPDACRNTLGVPEDDCQEVFIVESNVLAENVCRFSAAQVGRYSQPFDGDGFTPFATPKSTQKTVKLIFSAFL